MRHTGMTSITARIRRSVASISALLLVPAVIGLIVMAVYSSRTEAMIRRMEMAAGMKPALENTIGENLFSVAAGRNSYEASGTSELIAGIDENLDLLLAETSGAGRMQLTIARRTMNTLEQYALQVRDGMEAKLPIRQIEAVVDEVRDVGRLVADMLDDFTAAEIGAAAVTTRQLRRIMLGAALTEALLLGIAFFRTRAETRRLTESIHTALGSLEETVRRIAEGNFQDRVRSMNVEELRGLAEQINQTANQLESLIEQVRLNQEHLSRAELRTLQAQINPHFLYNTLDTIVWQAESGKGEEVVRLTRNLSDFFRISLSSGADWIPVSQELKHVSAYLGIQKTRYRDILDWEIIPMEGAEEIYMVKLLLQPLVENALYHGIKNRRGGGKITVRAALQNRVITFTVQDTGRGMSPERLREVEASLAADQPGAPSAAEPGDSGFGLRNVDLRIRLFYHKQSGLRIRSGPEGTEVSFSIPVKTREDIDHDESLSRG